MAPDSHDHENVGVVVARGLATGFTVGGIGGIVSTMNTPVAVDPELPRLSFPVTMIVCVPSERVRAEVKLYDPDCTRPLPRKIPPLLYMTTCATHTPPLPVNRGVPVFIVLTGDVIVTIPVPVAIQLDPHQLYPLPQTNVHVESDHVAPYVQLALRGE